MADAGSKRQRFGRVIVAGIVVWVVGVAALVVFRPGSGAAPEASSGALRPVMDLRVPDFAMTDQAGRAVDHTLLDGRVTVVGFVFTHCPLICPRLTSDMAAIQRRLAGTPVRLLSVSVDPAHDTPERLASFGERFGADFATWTFAVGDASTVDAIVRRGLSLALADDDSMMIPLASGGSMANIQHPSQLLLVGPDRRVYGLYATTLDGEVDRLVADAQRLAGGGRG